MFTQSFNDLSKNWASASKKFESMYSYCKKGSHVKGIDEKDGGVGGRESRAFYKTFPEGNKSILKTKHGHNSSHTRLPKHLKSYLDRKKTTTYLTTLYGMLLQIIDI